MAEEKTMAEQAQDEWFELAVENIDKLIPAEWSQQLNEVILPKVLKIIKLAIKKGIKDSQQLMGPNKMMIGCNMPVLMSNGETFQVPHVFKVDKDQLQHELVLKDGQSPEVTFSYLTILEKIDKYESVKELISDIRDGKFITESDLGIPVTEQIKIEAPKE